MIYEFHNFAEHHKFLQVFLSIIACAILMAIFTFEETRPEQKRKRHNSLLIFVVTIILLFFAGNLVIEIFFPIVEEDFYQKCEYGDLKGTLCNENILTGTATEVTPLHPDPLRIRQ